MTNENYDKKALEKILQYKKSVLENNNNAKTDKILNIAEILLDNYSYSAFQTYPRPTHPNVEKRKDVYFTMVAILLSLRTTLENEQKATESFLTHYKTPQDVLNSSAEELAEIIQAAGMPQKKSNTIINATKYVVNEFGCNFDKFKDIPIDKAREELKRIPGVGEKSADCLLELGLDLPTIVIDVNMLRVVSRVFNAPFATSPNLSDKKQLEIAKNMIEKNLPKDGLLYQVVHTMFLVHGKKTCKSIPSCEECIIENHCDYRKTQSNFQQKLDFSR